MSTRRIAPRAASLETVARQAGVSAATVSRIVNGETRRASPQTIARVEAAVAELGYRPNHVGRALRRRESRVVAMLAPNLDNPAMAAIAVSTEAALRAAGYVMILCDTHDRSDLQDEYLQAMRSQLVQGYVMVSAVASPALTEAVARGEPVVFVSRPNPDGGGAYVGIDNHAAGATAADHCLAQGIAQPAVIYPEQPSASTRQRAEGFVERLVARGLPREAIRQATAPGLSHIQIGYEAARTLVSQPGGWPQALLCVSDMMAYGAYRLSVEQGVAIPDRCLLIGVDGNPLNAWIAPWLTSVHIPYDDFGGKVVAQLEALWSGQLPVDVLLAHRLDI
ncbi:LacI family DNA-binding transcriptional regulator [Bosea sp. PAMC 26642]|uniref:LacI family DNA-binding transcriptional regulator n=1 Tax=Bosea sp. (strain PAMC 26642) TaxID=1792307 RepID=UPI000770085A|nr:LacI family DNA-binding transcriptional regulator [Bosea sp. PAMC 26642]AMJ59783.1 LacI family transcriptional regulator [Bosea sp. PAMC 26642]